MTPSIGDIKIESPNQGTLIITLPFEEGKMLIHFKEVRAFLTRWDGDPDPYLTHDKIVERPGDLVKVEDSRWLTSENFSLDIECSRGSTTMQWEHFIVVASDRSLHIAARDRVEAIWTGGAWTGRPGSWTFTAE
jgi:hypothetical protein